MRIEYRQPALSKKNLGKLDIVNDIIEEYRRQGYKLTLRQLYYQLVSRDVIPNNQSEYRKISHLLKEGRMGGIVDWEAIEDRLRVPYLPYYVSNVEDAIEDTIRYYRLDRQAGQDTSVMVIVEKDALSGVLKRVTSHYHVPLLVNRGYGSCTAVHDLAEAISGKDYTKIIYLGDHDPSGIDMVRDIEDRLQEFDRFNFEIERIALTDEQIDKYSPPPNPAKLKDPRAAWYIEQYGKTCWEVDALKPEVLNGIVSQSIENAIDVEQFEAMLKQEEEDKEHLREMI